jgi:hypothetical protein
MQYKATRDRIRKLYHEQLEELRWNALYLNQVWCEMHNLHKDKDTSETMLQHLCPTEQEVEEEFTKEPFIVESNFRRRFATFRKMHDVAIIELLYSYIKPLIYH